MGERTAARLRTYRQNLIIQGSFWIAAVLVGVIGVYFAKLIEWVQEIYYSTLSGIRMRCWY